jgi:hypothetical protein
MDIEDVPAIVKTVDNKEKLDRINFIIQCSCEGLISFDEAESQIDKIIRSKNDKWKQ